MDNTSAGLMVFGAGCLLIGLCWVLVHVKQWCWAKPALSYVPRGDRVIVKRLERSKPTAGDIFLPASQQSPLNEGTVIAVGPEIHDLKPGDRVTFVDHAGYDVEVDGETYLQMRDEEIIGKRLKGRR